MKIEDLALPGLLAVGVAGLAATALFGFAAGVAVSRDPEALRRAAQRVAREAARGLEQATLLAAQARERVGDLWAEAREHALADVDAADFERAATSADRRASAAGAAGASAGATGAAGAVGGAGAAPAPRKRSARKSPAAPRKSAARKSPVTARAADSPRPE
ncbi:MAG TPA: hypothetical protein PKB08_05815 [Burkholderiaceae bacterium]|jgi:hypothetical protein|nr:MAG: hypothetical protein ABS56_04335 [Lautropia sp. SCN 69-89]HMN64492.1 hypothetical protein [Burkholderiaceae bacterium]